MELKTILKASILVTLTSSCFPGEGFFEQSNLDSDSVQAVGVNIVGETSVAEVSADANITQNISVPSGSPLEGTSLSLPPGALAVDMTIVIQESMTPATDENLGGLGIVGATTNSIATTISNDQNIDSFANGNAATLQISTGVSTVLSLADGASGSRVMFSRHTKSDGSCEDLVYRLDDSDFQVLDSGIEVAVFRTGYFGTFQVITVPDLSFSKSSEETQWGTTILARVVPEECRIVSKVEKQALDQKEPISLGQVLVELNGQAVIIKADQISQDPDSCTATLDYGRFGKVSYRSSNSRIEFNLDGKGFHLNALGKVQCKFKDGRYLEKDITSLLPPGIRLEVDASERTVALSSDLPDGGTCVMDAYAVTDKNITHQESVSSASYYKVSLYNHNGPADYYARVTCRYSNGQVLSTPYARFTLEDCPSCSSDSSNSDDQEAPKVVNVQWPTSIDSPGTAKVQISATDNDSGIRELCYSLAVNSASNTFMPMGCFPLQSIGGDNYEALVSVPEYLPGGSYTVEVIEVSDNAGNTRWLNDRNSGGKYNQGYRLNNSQDYELGLTTVSIFSWNVNDLNSSDSDTDKPLIQSLSFSSPMSLTLPAELILDLGVTDAGGSLDGDHSFIPTCLTFQDSANAAKSFTECTHSIKQSPSSFQGKFSLRNSLESSTYNLKNIIISDGAGNEEIYYESGGTLWGSSVGSTGVNAAFSLTLTGGADYSPPVISLTSDAVTVDSSSYNVSSPVNMTVNVKASDSSGINQICVWINKYSGGSGMPRHMGCHNPTAISANEHSVTFNIPNYFSTGTQYAVTKVEVHDANGHVSTIDQASSGDPYYRVNLVSAPATSISTFDFTGGAPDTTPPVITFGGFLASSYPAGGMAKIKFDISDAASGVDPAQVCVVLGTSTNNPVNKCGTPILLAANTYEMQIELQPYMVLNQTYEVTDINVYDMAGNFGVYSHIFGTALTPAAGLYGQINITGAMNDVTAPVFSPNIGAVFSQPVYSVGNTAYLDIKVSDSESGIDPSSFVVHISGSVYTANGIPFQTSPDIWRFMFTLPSPGNYYLSYVQVADHKGNSINISGSYAGGVMSGVSWMTPGFTVNP